MTMDQGAASNYKDGTHVVLIASPPAGHTVPLLQLARALASCGVIVSIVCTDLHIEELKALKTAKSVSPIHDPSIRLVALQDGTAISSATFIDMMVKQPSLEARLAECLDLLLRKMLMSGEHGQQQQSADDDDNVNFGAPPPCCVISSLFVIGWTHDVATKHHLESHLLCTTSATLLCFALQLDRLMKEGRVPVTPENQSEVITSIPGLPSLHPLDLPRPAFLNPKSTRSDMVYRHFLRFGSASVILLNTFEELEGEALDGLRSQVLGGSDPSVTTRSIIPVGPMCLLQEADGNHETMESANDEYGRSDDINSCLQWLETQSPKSVLYVAFGSSGVEPHSRLQLHELAEGLEASEQPFLWVLKTPSTLHVIADLLPHGFLGRVEGRAFIYSGWAPQQEILKHPATAGFLTHCGWNSTLESISAGVPMLTWPLMAEQQMIARFLVDTSKLAIEIEKADKDFYKKEEIEAAVRRLFSEEEGGQVRKRVKDMCYSATHSASKQNVVKYVNELQMLKTLM